MRKTTRGEWDSQPDRFSFSFLGQSGTFKLNTQGAPVFESGMKGLMIVSPLDRTYGRPGYGAFGTWVITDQLGNIFIFGDGATETSETTSHGQHFYKDCSVEDSRIFADKFLFRKHRFHL